jgi:telomerase reverse transcriptase
MFSIGDLYARIKAFKLDLKDKGLDEWKLHFAKVDVRACFDSIPQKKLLKLMEGIMQESEYWMGKHAEIKPPDTRQYDGNDQESVRPSRKFESVAKPPDDFATFEQTVEQDFAVGKSNTIFVDMVAPNVIQHQFAQDLLQEHVEQHIVKIGKRFYRQKKGIPQGSVLSTYLCNFFYGELESQYLRFVAGPGTLLLRLIDDFLLITVDSRRARRFVQVMHDSIEEFGVQVDTRKSLVNFEMAINGEKLARPLDSKLFPYCGVLINTTTLEISKDRNRLDTGGKNIFGVGRCWLICNRHE